MQLEGGLLLYTQTIADAQRELMLLPDAVARIGTRATFVALGFGSFSSVNVLAPMTYLQGQLVFADRWTTTLTMGAHAGPIAARDIDPYTHVRHDVALRYRVNGNVRAGIGLGLTHNDPDAPRTKLGGELRFMLEWLRPE